MTNPADGSKNRNRSRSWESSRQKPGRRFEPLQELPLHHDAELLSAGLRGAGAGLLLMREVATPTGIPDLIAVVGDESRLEKRLSLDVPPLVNQIDSALVAALSSGSPRSLEWISRDLGWPIETLKRRVPNLLRLGAISTKNGTTYRRSPNLVDIGSIIAFEAKVSDWRRAVKQAHAYDVWADNYVIVMGNLSAGAQLSLDAVVKSDGAGWALGSQWRVKPKARHTSRSRHMWGSEHIVAALM
ncbi:hypothetical protein ACTQ49_09015 [Luteococcus sp. Sow4_B9]|uniref:hypothetical protein n=1 Tax=Luteococcus sp. Sow4_B9 TaxID=3438792 RepID=UPI003F96F309